MVNLYSASTRRTKRVGGFKMSLPDLGPVNLYYYQVDAYHKRRVKSSNGQVSIRYAIDTTIELFGETYPITVTLTNRSGMKFPMLIGRNFLRIHGFLIDLNRESA